jgi:hypothetical protein
MGLDGRGVGVRVPVGSKFLSSPRCPGRFWSPNSLLSKQITGVKRPRCEADQSPQTSVEVKNTWMYTSTPPYVFIAQWLLKHTGTLPFLFIHKTRSLEILNWGCNWGRGGGTLWVSDRKTDIALLCVWRAETQARLSAGALCGNSCSTME